jgi:hypothetical protein
VASEANDLWAVLAKDIFGVVVREGISAFYKGFLTQCVFRCGFLMVKTWWNAW